MTLTRATLILNKSLKSGGLARCVPRVQQAVKHILRHLAPKMPFGETDPHTLARTDGPETSKKAAKSIRPTALENRIYNTIATFPKGCISDEVRAEHPDLSYSSVTARFAALIAQGRIEVVGERKGASGRFQRVMKAKE